MAVGSLVRDSNEPVSLAARGSFASFTPASVDPKMARLIADYGNGKGRLMRFTPAGMDERPNRAVTVAVRVDEETARAISVRSALAKTKDKVGLERNLGITPTRYNLGISRGYQSFAQASQAPSSLNKALSEAAMPDLAEFKFVPEKDKESTASKQSRFGARISLQEESKHGRAPNTVDSVSNQTLDVAGSYSLTRNLNVTAGVRYSQERDRLAPLTDSDEKDSQAVYVGTQFRF
ncbi:hypothetical protein [Altericroceibacterium spongiae]|nr:hypothetical protein [Altericroceibacterium spongiae]